jgi:hypothetical protein
MKIDPSIGQSVDLCSQDDVGEGSVSTMRLKKMVPARATA